MENGLSSFEYHKFLLKHQVATAMAAFLPSRSKADYRCLMYHSIVEQGCGHDIYKMSLQKFIHQMQILKNGPWELIPFDQVAVPNKKALSITFDDGHRDNFELVYPLLRKMQIPFTIFVITDRVLQNDPAYLSHSQLVELSKDPLVTLGAHGKTHKPLASLPINEAIEELSESKKDLEDTIGRGVNVMSFPLGQWNSELFSKAREIGYTRCGTSVAKGNVFAKMDGLVSRQCLFSCESEVSFQQKLNGKWDFILAR
ncbi:MAG TPA: polysaccharide deacetylase family protein [Bdellovibrio sp.]|uniref:polysaccharide deacetylase family protein n=1 Tax=Bdellovibrio sp. TaxID=28201 RepID=UPI002EF3DDDF